MRWCGCEGNGCGRVITRRLWVHKRAFTGVYLRGFGPARRGSFCFGKRTQNHGRPGVALGGPLPRSRRLGLRNSLRSDSPRPQTRIGTGAQPRPQAP